MYWLIENEEQLNGFYNSGYKEAFIEIIPFNDKLHPTQNSVSLVYIRPLLASKGFMLCVDHSETLNGVNTHINAVLKKFDKLYCRDKKEVLHYFCLKELYDINVPPTTYIRPTTQTHELYYRQHGDNQRVKQNYPYCKTL